MLQPNYRALLCWRCLYGSPESSDVLPHQCATSTFSPSLFSMGVCISTHRIGPCPWYVEIGYRRHRGKTWKVPRYLKIQRSTGVQLIPNTLKKLAPPPLPACSTQATFQCLLLYLSLELQYYWEASGRLVLPYASQAYSGKVFTAQTTPFRTVTTSELSTLSSLFHRYQEILSPTLKWQLYILTVSNHLPSRFLLP